jgi:Lon protease-like protein
VDELLPLFPLGTVLFPGIPLPLHVFEPRYRELVSDLMAGPEPRAFGVVAIREGHEVGVDAVRALYDVGCVATVRDVQASPDGRFALMTTGGRRFRIVELDQSRPYLQAHVDFLEEPPGTPDDVDDVAGTVRQAFVDYRATLGGADPGVELPEDPAMLSFFVAATTVIALPERQELLEIPDTRARLARERDLLHRELGLMRTLRTMPVMPQQLPRHSQN